MNIQTGGKVSGVYGIKVLRNAGTDKEHLEDFGESPNMLLDGFFERFASGGLKGNGWSAFVGTGTAPVEATQTQLVSWVGSYDTMSVFSNDNIKVGEDYIASSTGLAKWDIGDIVGNISEVGIRLGDRIGSTVDSRALITDSQGNPTTITVTAEDKLEVSYTLKYIIPTQQQVSVFDFLGTPTTCTLERLSALNNSRNNIKLALVEGMHRTVRGSSTLELTNDPEDAPSYTNPADAVLSYSSPSQGVRRVTYYFESGELNVGGVKYLTLTSLASPANLCLGIHFDPPIPKDETKTLTLNFDFTLTRA